MLDGKLKSTDCGETIILGRDWNCCTDFKLDGTGEGPHVRSSPFLSHAEENKFSRCLENEKPFMQTIYLG